MSRPLDSQTSANLSPSVTKEKTLPTRPGGQSSQTSRPPLTEPSRDEGFRLTLLGAFHEGGVASFLDSRNVDKHALAAAIRLDESISLGWAEPLHCPIATSTLLKGENLDQSDAIRQTKLVATRWQKGRRVVIEAVVLTIAATRLSIWTDRHKEVSHAPVPRQAEAPGRRRHGGGIGTNHSVAC